MHETVTRMLETTPKGPFLREDELARCIDACFDCAQTCSACADACLGEDAVGMLTRCIRLNLDCADICDTTGRLLSRQQAPDFNLLRQAIELCEAACRACAEECNKHAAEHEHCKICSTSCSDCQRACRDLAAALGTASRQIQH